MDLGLFEVLLGGGVVLMIVMVVALSRFYKKVQEQGTVIVVNKPNGIKVHTTGGWVWPIIDKMEIMDITRKRISVFRKGDKSSTSEEAEGLPCKDNVRADIKVDFYIGVNIQEDEIKKVMKAFTAQKAGDVAELKEYFSPKFSEALKTAAKKFDFEELYTKRIEFRDEVKNIIGDDLDGFILMDVVIDYLEQSSLDSHNTDNMMDVDGIKKITERTAIRHIETNIITQDEKTKIKQKDVEAEAARLQLTKTEEEAKAKQDREIRVIQATEEALAKEQEEENRLREEKAIIKTDEQIGIETQNKDREIEIARLNQERVTKIEAEKVNRAKETEAVITEKEVAVMNMEKEKVVEEQMKEVAEITSQRVQIERKTAKEEEETKNLRTSEQANREKLVLVVNAEAKAEANLVQKVKESEAQKNAAIFDAETTQTNANAKLLESEKFAQGQIKMAEGVRASEAAAGLAQVEVQTAEATVIREKGIATAEAETEMAKAIRAKGNATAQAETDMAAAIRAQGEASAKNEEDMGLAKAKGAEAQYKAMSEIDEATREQEQFKLKIDMEKEVALAEVAIKSEISRNNAEVLGKSLEHSNIDIIGGETEIFDRISAAVVDGKVVDKKFDNSEVLNAFVKDYRGENAKSLPEDLIALLQKSDVSTGDIGTMTIAQLMANPKALGIIQGFLK